ncbi:hypothetical protein TNCV_118881 [Trichonephila clavipes]|nr:hypothetical protein TNCV_118881 [Trichonephila clavipes]
MFLNEEIVQPVSHTQIAFERCCLVKSYIVMHHVTSKNPFQNVYDFDKGQIVAYRNCCLSYQVLLLVSVEIQRLLAGYRIDGFRTVIRDTVLDLNVPLSLAAEKTDRILV